MTTQQQQLRLESIYAVVKRNCNKGGATTFTGRNNAGTTEAKRLAADYNRRRWGGQSISGGEFSGGSSYAFASAPFRTGENKGQTYFEFSIGESNVTVEDLPDALIVNGKPLDKKVLTEFLRRKAAQATDEYAAMLKDFFFGLVAFYGAPSELT